MEGNHEWKEDMDKRLEDVFGQIDLYARNMRSDMAAYKNKAEDLKEIEDRLRVTGVELKKKNDTYKENKEQLEEDRTQLDAAYAQLEEEKTVLTDAQKVLEEERKALEDEKKTVDELKPKYEQAKQVLAEGQKMKTDYDEGKKILENAEEVKTALNRRSKNLTERQAELDEKEQQLLDYETKLSQKEKNINKAYVDLEKQRKEFHATADGELAESRAEMGKLAEDMKASRERLLEQEEAFETKEDDLLEKEHELDEINQSKVLNYLLKNSDAAQKIMNDYGAKTKPRIKKPPKKKPVSQDKNVLDDILKEKRGKGFKDEFNDAYDNMRNAVEEAKGKRFDTAEAEEKLKAAETSARKKLYNAGLNDLKDVGKALEEAERRGPYSESIRLNNKHEEGRVLGAIREAEFVEGKDYRKLSAEFDSVKIVSLNRDVTALVTDELKQIKQERIEKEKAAQPVKRIALTEAAYQNKLSNYPEMEDYFEGMKDGKAVLGIPKDKYDSLIDEWDIVTRKAPPKKPAAKKTVAKKVAKRPRTSSKRKSTRRKKK